MRDAILKRDWLLVLGLFVICLLYTSSRGGALLRHAPELLPALQPSAAPAIPLDLSLIHI